MVEVCLWGTFNGPNPCWRGWTGYRAFRLAPATHREDRQTLRQAWEWPFRLSWGSQGSQGWWSPAGRWTLAIRSPPHGSWAGERGGKEAWKDQKQSWSPPVLRAVSRLVGTRTRIKTESFNYLKGVSIIHTLPIPHLAMSMFRERLCHQRSEARVFWVTSSVSIYPECQYVYWNWTEFLLYQCLSIPSYPSFDESAEWPITVCHIEVGFKVTEISLFFIWKLAYSWCPLWNTACAQQTSTGRIV